MVQLTQFLKRPDGSAMPTIVGVVSDSTGDGGARVSPALSNPDGSVMNMVGLILIDPTGNPLFNYGGAGNPLTLNLPGRLNTIASAAINGAGLNIAPGVAPNVPGNGDIWLTNSGLFAFINNAVAQLAQASTLTRFVYGGGPQNFVLGAVPLAILDIFHNGVLVDETDWSIVGATITIGAGVQLYNGDVIRVRKIP